MKREFVEDRQEDHRMFSKIHQSHDNKFYQSPPPHNHSAAAHATDGQTHSPDRRRNADNENGATIEVVRRPRGRPPGSKNKPKPPVFAATDSTEQAMSPYVLELPGGVDIIKSTTNFCRRRGIGLCLLNGNGAVTNVALKQPSTNGATVTFPGRFDILSISATILPHGSAAVAANSPFALSLAGPQGQVVGGHVVGPLISAGTIYLVAANFSNPSFHRLQQEQEESVRDGGGASPKSGSGGGGGGQPAATGGAPAYSYQSCDVMWAPAARQQQPYGA